MIRNTYPRYPGPTGPDPSHVGAAYFGLVPKYQYQCLTTKRTEHIIQNQCFMTKITKQIIRQGTRTLSETHLQQENARRVRFITLSPRHPQSGVLTRVEIFAINMNSFHSILLHAFHNSRRQNIHRQISIVAVFIRTVVAMIVVTLS